MQKVKCEICSECGDGYWAGEHKDMTKHNSFTLLCGGENEPPSNKSNMDISSGFLFADGALARRFKGIRALWNSDWDVCPVGGIVSRRRYLIPANL